MSEEYPQLLKEYFKFIRIYNNYKISSLIDLSKFTWFYPTSLLPLCNLIKNNERICISPRENVSNYINTVMGTTYSPNKSYLPIIFLPTDSTDGGRLLNKLNIWYDGGKLCGGTNAFNYLIGEFVDNIYQHSEFMNGCVLAQKYDAKGFLEIAFFDDGISIPGCFERNDIAFSSDSEAIHKATNGYTTKKSIERGFGMKTSINLYVNGIGGELLIVSRGGALYKSHHNNEEKLYKLSSTYELEGTLIAVRIPYPAKEVNIYEHIS
ncbi:MAG: hypothetical protein KAT05_11240 [Spirochaetes bacterium]|nr:hypothetical protein [Spirochaetota bacterium]